MRFGPVPLGEAEGAILAHSLRLGGQVLRKGAMIGPAQVAGLRAAGLTEVVVARLDPGDLHEDAAAAAVAAVLLPDPAGQGLRVTPASTGRVNLHATGPGVLRVDAPAIRAFNGVNPMITLACLPPYARLAAGDMVATVKIIAYGVPGADLARACALLGPALARAAPVHATATLIETRLGATPPPKGRTALAGRLARLGLTLGPRVVVAHERQALAQALRDATGDIVLVLTASATSDPEDVGPAALRAAGGEVVQFGIPVDPGNLLFLGRLGQKPVIGLPGCARSPALNGADFVLERVACGVSVTPGDLAALGVGGLLKEIASRPRPRTL